MIKVLVTGANGQLGKCLQDYAHSEDQIEFTLLSHIELILKLVYNLSHTDTAAALKASH